MTLKMSTKEKMLNWFESEKIKDAKDVEEYKRLTISEIANLSKDNWFKKPKKKTIWQKIKIILFGG